MKLTVKAIRGGQSAVHSINVEDTNISVREFKEQISGTVGLSAENIRLVCAGRVFEDNFPLIHYEPNESTAIHCLT